MPEEKQPKLKKEWYKTWWVWPIIIIVVIIIAAENDTLTQTEEKNTAIKTPAVNNVPVQKEEKKPVVTTPVVDQASNQPKELSELGAEGYLRISGKNDSSQVVILTEKKENYELVTKAFMAKDYEGLLEIPGAFGVSNGTKIKIIDTAFGIRRVRIIEGVREIDSDKVGRTGWTAKEFVLDK